MRPATIGNLSKSKLPASAASWKRNREPTNACAGGGSVTGRAIFYPLRGHHVPALSPDADFDGHARHCRRRGDFAARAATRLGGVRLYGVEALSASRPIRRWLGL